jgi:Transposase, Mutator family
MYPVVFFDALRVKIREDAVVRNKAIYLALGVLPGGTRENAATVARRRATGVQGSHADALGPEVIARRNGCSA